MDTKSSSDCSVKRPSIILQEKLPEVKQLMEEYKHMGIVNLRAFGSVARGEDTENSDIDFVVTIQKGDNGRFPGFCFCEFEDRLSQILGVSIDIVTESSCSKSLREAIKNEAISI